MSNRAQRREAGRLARKQEYQQMRQQQQQQQSQHPPAAPAAEQNAKLNATQHGCCAVELLILPSENQADFDAVAKAWRTTFKPTDLTTAYLINLLIAADWLHQRSFRTLIEVQAKIIAAVPDPLNWTDEHHKLLSRFERYRTANLNAFHKARRAVEDHLKCRSAEIHQAERLHAHRTRQKVYELKHRPEPSFDEIIANMHRQAIEKGYAKAPPPTQP